jgi:choline dehydrogenase-like flavoprotein
MASTALAKAFSASTLEAIEAPGAVDAVVIGSGAAGGLAAALLTEAGLRVLVLEAGPCKGSNSLARRMSDNALHSLTKLFSFSYQPLPMALRRNALRAVGWWRQPIQCRYRNWDTEPGMYVDDLDNPYITPPDYPFIWVRSRRLGGRMLIHGHGWQYYRLAPEDFCPTDGLSPAWPLKADELNRWYAVVERRLKLSGAYDSIPWLPDSELAHEREPTVNERMLESAIVTRWPMAKPVIGRFAPPLEGLELAAATGRLLIRQSAIAREIRIKSGRAYGLHWIDLQNGGWRSVEAPLIFLCASTLESTRLLLLSLHAETPALGRNLMDHIKVNMRSFVSMPERTFGREQGRCLYLPRFDARDLWKDPPPGRGFGVQVYHSPLKMGGLHVLSAASFGEMTPRPENSVMLDDRRKDAWNIPILRIRCGHSEAERRLARDQSVALRELAQVAGAKLILRALSPPGSACHECGTARMGTDPSNSVLDPFNECWDARGLYVTDGASFPSQGYANPTLTIMALTARACGHALGSNRGDDDEDTVRSVPMGDSGAEH